MIINATQKLTQRRSLSSLDSIREQQSGNFNKNTAKYQELQDNLIELVNLNTKDSMRIATNIFKERNIKIGKIEKYIKTKSPEDYKALLNEIRTIR